MPYGKRIVCLANSFKIGGSCIAGKEMPAGRDSSWIRPVSARETAEVRPQECRLYDHALPKDLDILEIPLLRALPCGHQTENHLIDPACRWNRVGTMAWSELSLICDRPASLWINGNHTKRGTNNCVAAEQASSLRNSLFLIRPESFCVEVPFEEDDRPIRRLWSRFRYNGEYYALRLTDPVMANAFRGEPEGDYLLENVYLCVSLTEPYKQDGRCHKLVAAVLSERESN